MTVDLERQDAGERVEALAREQGQALVALAYVLTADAHEAQDCVQSVLARLLKSERSVRVADLSAYARRAVANEVLDRHRSRNRLMSTVRRLRLYADSNQPLSDETGFDDRDAIRRALETIGPRARTAVVLRYYSGMSDTEIAEALDCAQGTVRSLISRSLPRLRAELDPKSRRAIGLVPPDLPAEGDLQ